MNHPRVSIIVVSRGRPDALRRCLLSLSQLFYHPFEVVVVADADGRAAMDEFAGQTKMIAFDDPNISAARNAGLDHAAGQIVAFIDDDAVAEPSWLDHLIAPFSDPSVSASGGWVRGRNGISFQNKSRMADKDGQHSPVAHPGPDPILLRGSADAAPRTEGTNMAWRRAALADLGGFNPAYRFFLDETDLNMRLARRGGTTALVPLAQVHHGFAPSVYRRADRVPLDLFEIGASWAVFLNHYSDHPKDARHAARLAERTRMIRHAIRGNVWPSAIRARLAEFDAGYAEGATRSDGRWTPAEPPPFQPFHDAPAVRSSIAIAAGLRKSNAARRAARAAVANGERVSLWTLSATTLYHQVRFDDGGFWHHAGGIWGRSDRAMPLISPMSIRRRVALEVAKVSKIREISATHFIEP